MSFSGTHIVHIIYVIPGLKKENYVQISAMSMTTCHKRNSLKYKWYKWKDTLTVRHQSNTNRIQMALNTLWREKDSTEWPGSKTLVMINQMTKQTEINYSFKKYLNIT
jgi:hypothetical protein